MCIIDFQARLSAARATFLAKVSSQSNILVKSQQPQHDSDQAVYILQWFLNDFEEAVHPQPPPRETHISREVSNVKIGSRILRPECREFISSREVSSDKFYSRVLRPIYSKMNISREVSSGWNPGAHSCAKLQPQHNFFGCSGCSLAHEYAPGWALVD